jgi:hypothetical protein
VAKRSQAGGFKIISSQVTRKSATEKKTFLYSTSPLLPVFISTWQWLVNKIRLQVAIHGCGCKFLFQRP